VWSIAIKEQRMAQTIWKGAISFGLVSIPVRVFAATDERGVSLRQVHASDGGRIRYRRICELEGEEVPYSEIARGYELPDGGMVVLTDEDLDKLPLPSTKSVEVLQFVPTEQIDSLHTARSYYLKADGAGAKPYVLLRDALERTGKVAVVKVALRSRESLATVRPYQGVLLLQMMLWPEEIRDATEFVPDEDVSVRAQEIAMAESYIETLTGDFAPEDHTDEYRAALEAVVEAKAAGQEVVAEAPARPAAEVVDLMEALRQSVARAKQERAGGASEAPPAKKAPAGKAAPKTGAAKKTAAAKQAPAKQAEKKPTARAATAEQPAKKTAAKKAPDKEPAKKTAGRTRRSA
jgi:DNA end-binding protein Ku